jgi:hypothetical protein
MPTDSIKLTYSFLQRLIPAVAYTLLIVGLLAYTTQTVYIWLLIAFFAILAVNYWMRVFWPDTVLEISEKGIWYQEYEKNWIHWEDIVWFNSTTYGENVENRKFTILVIKNRHRFLNIEINLSTLHTDENQVREWIKAYAGIESPVDEGHKNIESTVGAI